MSSLLGAFDLYYVKNALLVYLLFLAFFNSCEACVTLFCTVTIDARA